MKLHELSADVERAVTLTSDLIKALRARHPFQLAYQGVNDRALQQIYGDMIGRFPRHNLHHRPATGEPIRLGVVSSFFYRHSNRTIPLKVGRANSIASAACHLDAIRDEQTEAAATLYDRFIHRTALP